MEGGREEPERSRVNSYVKLHDKCMIPTVTHQLCIFGTCSALYCLYKNQIRRHCIAEVGSFHL